MWLILDVIGSNYTHCNLQYILWPLQQCLVEGIQSIAPFLSIENPIRFSCLAGCDIICRNTLTNKAFNNLTILVEWWFWIHKLSNYSILLLLDKWWREGLKWGDSLNQRLARVNSDHVSILECSDLGYEFH